MNHSVNHSVNDAPIWTPEVSAKRSITSVSERSGSAFNTGLTERRDSSRPVAIPAICATARGYVVPAERDSVNDSVNHSLGEWKGMEGNGETWLSKHGIAYLAKGRVSDDAMRGAR